MNSKKLFLTSSRLSADMKKKFFDIIGKCPEDVRCYTFQLLGLKQMEREKALQFVFRSFHLWVFGMKIY